VKKKRWLFYYTFLISITPVLTGGWKLSEFTQSLRFHSLVKSKRSEPCPGSFYCLTVRLQSIAKHLASNFSDSHHALFMCLKPPRTTNSSNHCVFPGVWVPMPFRRVAVTPTPNNGCLEPRVVREIYFGHLIISPALFTQIYAPLNFNQILSPIVLPPVRTILIFSGAAHLQNTVRTSCCPPATTAHISNLRTNHSQPPHTYDELSTTN